MITVEATDTETRVIIPRGELDPAQIEAILCPFQFTSLVSGSQMSKAEAMKLADESEADWWAKNEHRFAPST